MGSLSSNKEQKIQEIFFRELSPERLVAVWPSPGTLVLKYDAEKRVVGCLLTKMGGVTTLSATSRASFPLQSALPMPTFCDVALPVPLDMAFTYKIGEHQPVVGGRVLVPFRTERLSGVVTALHDRAPSMQAKAVIQVLDSEPVLDEGLMKLGQWISQYYMAPIGDGFRGQREHASEYVADRRQIIRGYPLPQLHQAFIQHRLLIHPLNHALGPH